MGGRGPWEQWHKQRNRKESWTDGSQTCTEVAAVAPSSSSVGIANEMLVSIVKAGASRQVVAATASALIRTCVSMATEADVGQQTVKQLQLHEELEAIGHEVLGHNAGIGRVTHALKDRGHGDLAREVSDQNKVRRYLAHPHANLAGRLAAALRDDQPQTLSEGSGATLEVFGFKAVAGPAQWSVEAAPAAVVQPLARFGFKAVAGPRPWPTASSQPGANRTIYAFSGSPELKGISSPVEPAQAPAAGLTTADTSPGAAAGGAVAGTVGTNAGVVAAFGGEGRLSLREEGAGGGEDEASKKEADTAAGQDDAVYKKLVAASREVDVDALSRDIQRFGFFGPRQAGAARKQG
mmetsp:Transcript_137811/g.274800  ORF Transcript_137811/g.274800 Transcript_137811/m.274800 type:complete len:351 (+) Transcript_137811:58-1110(+)